MFLATLTLIRRTSTVMSAPLWLSNPRVTHLYGSLTLGLRTSICLTLEI